MKTQIEEAEILLNKVVAFVLSMQEGGHMVIITGAIADEILRALVLVKSFPGTQTRMVR